MSASESKWSRAFEKSTTRIAAVVVVLLLVAGSAWLRFGTGSPGQGQALTIANDAAPTPLPSGLSYACPATLTNMSLRVERSGSQLVVVDATTGSPVDAIWPYGFSALLVDGKAELLDSDGTVVAREGDVLTSVNGSWTGGEVGGPGWVINISGFNGDCYTPSGIKVGGPGWPTAPPAQTGLGSQEP